ncbi:MAG: hypothetical protein IIY55_07145 [Blautia sp.]|nr:hypothetical protein [Blautia sp.]
MNEIRDLIVGLDFGREYTQICYYDRRAQEMRSLSLKAGASQYEAPTALYRRADAGEFMAGPDTGYFAEQHGGELISDLYELSGQREGILFDGEKLEPWNLIAHFLKGMLRFLGVADIQRNIKCLAITTEDLTPVRVRNFRAALKEMGFGEEQCILLDYAESFYYYAMTLPQKKEILNRSVGWYDFMDNLVLFRRMYVAGSATRPVVVKLDRAVKGTLPENEEDKDDAFCKFIQRTLGNDPFSSIQLTGRGFDQSWAKQSVKMLCFQKRKVYSGNNLYARGACCAAKERCEDRALRGFQFLSKALVNQEVGMEMRIMGSDACYSLISAGRNWYECHKTLELLLDGTQELAFTVSTLGGADKRRVAMPLPGLPERPPKTTRLLLEMEYVSPEECIITVTDLGFGELFPSSGKVWRETVRWQEEGR